MTGEFRDVLLLGAGASMDAGLPDAYGLTDRILESVPPGAERDILVFVVGGLLFAEGVRGGNPRGRGVDIESVARALERIARRKTSDVESFIGSWHHRLQELEQLCPSRPSATGTNSPFEATIAEMLFQLREILWRRFEHETSYFEPLRAILARQKRLVVATLNYDNTVESFCGKAGIPYSTGIPEMGGFNPKTGYVLETIENGVLLLKLHGSLNWSVHSPLSNAGFVATPMVITWGIADPHFGSMAAAKPAVLFGGENKLTAEGPFMQLLVHFREQLLAATRLTIVGYSFRDQHVNAQITDFVNQKTDGQVVVIDPGANIQSGFLQQVSNGIRSRLTVVRDTAANGLAHVFNSTTA